MISDILNLLYNDTFSTFEVKNITDNKTFLTSQVEVPILQDIPCRCSYSAGISPTSAQKKDDNYFTKNQTIKIITKPEHTVKPGTKIVVTKEGGSTTTYRASGQPAIYSSHQEIIAQLEEATL